MLVPTWTRSEGGVWMPAPPGRETLQLELGRNVAGARIVAVLEKLPDSESQVFAFLDERAIGIALSTLPQQINRVARVSFESAALYISAMSMATAQVPPGRERQITLVRDLFIDGEIAAGAERALAAGEGSVAVAEQHLSALARLAVRHSDRSRSADLERDARTLERALVGSSALAMGDAERIRASTPDHSTQWRCSCTMALSIRASRSPMHWRETAGSTARLPFHLRDRRIQRPVT